MRQKILKNEFGGRLYGDWRAIVTLQVLFAFADYEGLVLMSVEDLASATSIPKSILKHGLDRLLAPDNDARYSFQKNGYIAKIDPIGWEIRGFESLVWNGRMSPWKWAPIRKLIFERDGYRCQYCGKENVPLEPDHVHPISKGGGNEFSNLVAACVPCNRSKGSKTLEEWKR